MDRYDFTWRTLVAGWFLLVTVACAENSQTDADAATEQDLPPAAALLRERAIPFTTAEDLTPLLDRIGDASLVLLGEASHGTSEFYTWRAKISQRLISERGFNFIAVEGDWHSLWRLNQYVKHQTDSDLSAAEIMQTFQRWPTWMWANEETRDLIEWLRQYNADLPLDERVGFYGMDVYGEDQSFVALRDALEDLDEEMAAALSQALDCLAPYHGNMHDYVRAVAFGHQTPCHEALEEAWNQFRARTQDLDPASDSELFALQMNAKVLKNAERHFRFMATQGPSPWNARVDHFYAVVARLLDVYGEDARGIAWAHNTHIGDARATAMASGSQRNIGQIARERHGADVVAVGFGTHRGTVQAGRQWGQTMETMQVPPGIPGSVEDFMHQAGYARALFIFDPTLDWTPLETVLGHRAMGVVYNPEVEHRGNYVPTLLIRRYDAFLFFDESNALRPIH